MKVLMYPGFLLFPSSDSNGDKGGHVSDTCSFSKESEVRLDRPQFSRGNTRTISHAWACVRPRGSFRSHYDTQ